MADPQLKFGDEISIALRNKARQYRGNHPMNSRWRMAAAPIVMKVLLDNAGQPLQVVRAALRKAYPFGPKSNWPYRIWLDEIRRQVKTLYG